MGSRGFVLRLLVLSIVFQSASPLYANSIFDEVRERARQFFRARHTAPYPDTRTFADHNPRFLSDYEYLKERRYASDTLGVVTSAFVPELDTRVYATATARPDSQGRIGLVDTQTKGVFFFFHGSGTAKAGGANFAMKMNRLALMGYTAIGFDLPFHQDGSQNPELYDSAKFVDYLHDVIQTLRPGGKPVYFVGHSYGPELISELLTRYPRLAQGAALISPGGVDEVTQRWYEEKTLKMPFMRMTPAEENEAGAAWADRVTRNFIWNKIEKRPDPTLVNPKLKVHVLYGDREEYVPGPLNPDGSPAPVPRTYDLCKVYKKIFRNAKCTVEPGVGHYIFEFKDVNGQDVIMRTLLDLAGESIENEKAIRQQWAEHLRQSRTLADHNLTSYHRDIFFKGWIDRTIGKQKLVELRDAGNQRESQALINDYKMISKQRDLAMLENIRKLENLAPQFYETIAQMMVNSAAKNFDTAPVFSRYLHFLESPDGAIFRSQMMVSEDVFVLPEKKKSTAPDPAELERLRALKAGQRNRVQPAQQEEAHPLCSSLVKNAS